MRRLAQRFSCSAAHSSAVLWHRHLREPGRAVGFGMARQCRSSRASKSVEVQALSTRQRVQHGLLNNMESSLSM